MTSVAPGLAAGGFTTCCDWPALRLLCRYARKPCFQSTHVQKQKQLTEGETFHLALAFNCCDCQQTVTNCAMTDGP